MAVRLSETGHFVFLSLKPLFLAILKYAPLASRPSISGGRVGLTPAESPCGAHIISREFANDLRRMRRQLQQELTNLVETVRTHAPFSFSSLPAPPRRLAVSSSVFVSSPPPPSSPPF